MTSINGIVYDLNSNPNTATVGNNQNFSGAANIPATVTSGGIEYPVVKIGNYAFYNCTGLTSVSIPASVTSIGIWAFNNCIKLTSVTFLGNAPTNLGTYIFYSSHATIIYYISGKTGWTNPWAGRPTVALAVKHNYSIYFRK